MKSTVKNVRRFSTLCLTASLLASTSLHAATVDVSETAMIVQHVTVSSSKAYPAVIADIESNLSRLDDRFRQMAKDKRTDELQTELQKAAGKYGLMIHYTGSFTNWLALKGVQKRGTEYFTGNILTAVEMTNQNMGAGLYAPLRIMVYENAQGGTTIEYDKPSTLLSQYHSAAIDVQGRSLDERLAKLCNAVLQ
ncbi:DUF302 domain-containing protein [Paraburkholderia phenoliruptrix]|uniref:DUF302 domain-containing protein n=1 Tax=Paraburkholderia phenoliruptrix TaxID=252970 RepID=UPI001C4ED981|nr:DUF302 domain-containing protein [Paraburkholderia phenoliruptrix]MBW0450947.1 DUF302 domain-containing protein [Paraburkholderia phenoliruptrix]MBW9096548.1 DUF302 domain-containing protein [Paraburkholderia phenoliruptrix]